MPEISNQTFSEIKQRLDKFLTNNPQYSSPKRIGSGGSAVVFRVEFSGSFRAIKVYDPKFFSSPGAPAEIRRLDLQRSLIGHSCPSLVEVFGVTQCEGTAFIEMEYVEWPQLKAVLESVPDERISELIGHLVKAVMYLESADITHRDIKPENIHISPNFTELKLIDLGVARQLALPNEEGEDATDDSHHRPFIATAQYSSPEYLFRLDAPSEALWKALNIYQVGAVLHDMINKRPLFAEEVSVGNRFVVARAVLNKAPTFPDKDPLRLSSHKALAIRCLVKDMITRLQIVSWSDFHIETSTSALSLLRARISKGKGAAGNQSLAASEARSTFEREQFAKRFCDSVRTELIAALEKSAQLTMTPSPHGSIHGYRFEFNFGASVSLIANLTLRWTPEPHDNSAQIAIDALIHCGLQEPPAAETKVLHVATIGVSEEVVAVDVANKMAELICRTVDILAGQPEPATIHGADIGKVCFEGG